MSIINLIVNDREVTVDVDPEMPLLYVLSDFLELNGPRFGCGLGQCGACTVIVEGFPIRSCITPVRDVEGAGLITLEGLGTPDNLHPIQKAFIEEQAFQCGFCASGVILTAKATLDQNPQATVQEIEQGMDGVLCRCCAHTRIVKAIERYQKEVA
jgi:aerobic-type carbon monoxide dehydrogenase small subunit (CoxS/CutS family)